MDIILCGIGKIARDQHIPALAASGDWTLAATVSRAIDSSGHHVQGVPAHTTLDAALAAHPEVQVYSLCQPPAPRYALARQLIDAGKDVMLEKPPGATLAEIYDLRDRAAAQGTSFFTTWHSRMADAVQPAADWLGDKTITSAHITWKEDVRLWHPGQDWVFDPGGMGVFDPGINALSILTHILPDPVHLRSSVIEVPQNRSMPIAAKLHFSGNVSAELDWRHEGPQTWDIDVETDAGTLSLRDGGATLRINGEQQPVSGPGEYPALYSQMANLVRARESDTDLSPMVHVSDAFTLARRNVVPDFHF